jgi:arylsulfatase A-like enzyme
MPQNVILISVDSLRFDFMQIAGKTLPNFNRLLNKSYYFANAVTQGTSSIQSHASALSGLGPWSIGTGVHLHFPKPKHSIFYKLNQLGYDVTTWHRGVVYLEDRPEEKEVWNNRAGNNTCADEFIDDICAFIKEPPKSPYCVFLHFRYVHWPYGDCEGWSWGDERYEEAKAKILNLERNRRIAEVKQLYTECLVRMDKKLGKLLDSLHGDEIVILFGDHGDSFGDEMEDVSKFDITDAHVNSPWEPVCRVPLFIRTPQKKKSVSGILVRLLDIAPTLWNLLELPIDSEFEGFPLLTTKGHPSSIKFDQIFAETWGDFYCSAPSSETGVAWGKDYRIIKEGNFKLVMELYEGTCQLFNIKSDEKTDISKEFPEITEYLASRVHYPSWPYLEMYEQSQTGRLQRLMSNQRKILADLSNG